MWKDGVLQGGGGESMATGKDTEDGCEVRNREVHFESRYIRTV